MKIANYIRVEREMPDRQPPQTEERAGCDRFGFLPSNVNCQFQDGAIEPVTNYEEVKKWVQEHLYHESLSSHQGSTFEPGILFPPQAWKQAHDPTTDELLGVVRGSKRPSPLHHVPTSHYLRLDGITDLMAAREGGAGFVTKIIGFLYDAPIQFHDWWFSGAKAIARDNLDPCQAVLEDFVSHAYTKWRSWKPENQQRMIAALDMHGRAPGYQWEWERFAWEYTVTDACYQIAANLSPSRFCVMRGNAWQRLPHGKRIERMCQEFKLRLNTEEQDWVESIIKWRNDLIHEARWSSERPSTKSSEDAFSAPMFLHALNQRLITGLLGYENAFVANGWLTFSRVIFDKKK